MLIKAIDIAANLVLKQNAASQTLSLAEQISNSLMDDSIASNKNEPNKLTPEELIEQMIKVTMFEMIKNEIFDPVNSCEETDE